jgi:UDP-N-acetyl-D-glucosamine dehydrogenase
MNSIKKIAVVGLGYVGLPLALLAEEKGFQVTGIDLDTKKIESLSAKKATIDEPIINRQIEQTRIDFTSKLSGIATMDAVIICVPTPVDGNKTPDLKPVINAVKSTAPSMKAGSLLVIESTINPGVCDELIIPLIEKESKHRVGETIHLAHCPERINPGDPKWNVSNINRVVGADSKKGLELAYEFYRTLVDAEIMKMGSLKEAEAVKIVENSFRDINIAFVNELAMSFNKLGININNVINGAATKPFAFMPHYPGIGVGGHCIPVDPYYLIEYARGKGFNHEFLKLARSINEGMPKFVVDTIIEALIKNGNPQSLKGKNAVVLGLSYKPNVADDRMSPSYSIVTD